MAGASFAAQPEHETISVRRIAFLLSRICSSKRFSVASRTRHCQYRWVASQKTTVGLQPRSGYDLQPKVAASATLGTGGDISSNRNAVAPIRPPVVHLLARFGRAIT